MSRPTTLYVPHILSAEDIEAEERFDKIANNLSCYGISVVNNRRPEEIIAYHKTISGVLGDFCSAFGSPNETIYDPHKTEDSSVYISMLIKGHQEITGTRKTDSASVSTGTLIVHQRADYFRYKSDEVKQLYIIPHSQKVKEIFSGKLKGTIISLENHHLASFLKSQMLLLDTHCDDLSPRETALIVDTMHNFALMMLSDVASAQGLISLGKHSVIYNNAVSYIAQHFSEMNLSPDQISHFLRCSRASLDRAFKEKNTSVMNVIKNTRLDAARELLSNNNGLRIEQVSWKCGFVNHALFSRLFREKFNASPKTWRDNFKTSYNG